MHFSISITPRVEYQLEETSSTPHRIRGFVHTMVHGPEVK